MPWIFLCLMMANAIYFGLKFVESGQTVHQPLIAAQVQIGKPIMLLSEGPKVAAPVVLEKPSGDAVEGLEPLEIKPNIRQCYSVGPFSDEAVLKQWADQMQNKQFVVRIEKRRADIKDYWVFVPPLTTREKSEERLRELKARGIDGFIVSQGQFINAISLNRFSKQELAQEFLHKMQAAGISVEYRENSQPATEYWANLSPGASTLELKSSIDAFLAKKTAMRRENTACSE